jgi:hypothetical protein
MRVLDNEIIMHRYLYNDSLVFRFILLQVFTQPCHSSFIKPCPSHPQTQGEWGLLLEPTLAAVIALTYCFASPALFVVISVFQSGPWGVVSPGFVVSAHQGFFSLS